MQRRCKQTRFLERHSAQKVSTILPLQKSHLQQKPKINTPFRWPIHENVINPPELISQRPHLTKTKHPLDNNLSTLSQQFSGEPQTEPSRPVRQHPVATNHNCTSSTVTATITAVLSQPNIPIPSDTDITKGTYIIS